MSSASGQEDERAEDAEGVDRRGEDQRIRPASTTPMRTTMPASHPNPCSFFIAQVSSRLRFEEARSLSLQSADCEREREPEGGEDSDELAALLERLRHHRVGQHGQDRAAGERAHERQNVP